MPQLDSYIGITPFTVHVDQSPQLDALTAQARELRPLDFSEKLRAVKKLAVGSMKNAYEQMHVWEELGRQLATTCESNAVGDAVKKTNFYRDIVFKPHPLSYALENKAGCCRYQGALFFVLGLEAQLGEQHFLQAAPVTDGINSVFNEVYQDGQRHVVSIFAESLENKLYDYSVQNPKVFDQAFDRIPGFDFYSYHSKDGSDEYVLVGNPEEHAIKPILQTA